MVGSRTMGTKNPKSKLKPADKAMRLHAAAYERLVRSTVEANLDPAVTPDNCAELFLGLLNDRNRLQEENRKIRELLKTLL